MLQLLSGPALRVGALVPLGLALAIVPVRAQVDTSGPPPATAMVEASKRLPLSSVSGLARYIEGLKAAKAVKATRNTGERAEREGAQGGDAKYIKKGAPARGEREEEGDAGWLDAYNFFVRQRAFPGDKIDWSAARRAASARDRLPAARLRSISSTPNNGAGSGNGSGNGSKAMSVSTLAVSGPTPRWEFVGPKNMKLPARFYGPNPACGRVNAIAYTTPVKGQPDTMSGTIYIGSPSGGVWKSTNGGITWNSISAGWPTLAVSSIAVDPTNPNRVYAGTGDFQGYQVYPIGVMKSSDGGATWTNTGFAQFGTTSVSHIIVDPESPNVVTVSTGLGTDFYGYVWRSTDYGTTWTKAFDSINIWSGLALSVPDAQGKRAYYAAGLGQVYRSLDRGLTWTSLPLPASSTLGPFPDITASRVDPKGLYMLSPAEKKAFRSTDAGNTWSDISSNLTSTGDWSQYFYDYHINTMAYVDRFNRTRETIFVGLIDLHSSKDGGASWQSVGNIYTSSAVLHPDQHAMAVNPRNPNDALVGCDGGLYRVVYDPRLDYTRIYPNLNQGLGITEFYHGSYHPFDATRMIGGAQDNSSPVASGDLDNWDNVIGGDGGACEIHPLSPNIQYGSSQFLNIVMTRDAWKSSTGIGSPPGPRYFIAPIAVDPQDPNILYAGTDTVWRFNNKTFAWQSLAPYLSSFDAITFIAVAPTDSNVIYASSGAGEMFMTTDGGKNWTEIDQGATSLPYRYITSIAVNPDNPNRVVVAVSGSGESHVWKCDDTTAANPVWVDAGTGLPDVPTNTVALDPTDPANTYYVGTDVGAFVTQNGGSSWTNMTAPLGLPNVRVDELRHVYGTGFLNAATYGRGMWRIQIANPVAPVSKLASIPTIPHGGQAMTLVINLIAPAPLGGQKVTLQSSNPAVVSVPSSTTVVAGFNILQLKVSTGRVTSKTPVTITANAGGKSRTLKMTVAP